MDWLIWVIVIVLIIAIVWWLLNRNNSGNAAGAAGSPSVDRVPPSGSADGVRTDGALAGGGAAASAAAAPTTADDARNWPETAEASAAGTAASDAPNDVPAPQEEPASDAAGDVDDWAGDGPAPETEAAVSAPSATAGALDEASSVPGAPAVSHAPEDTETLGTTTADVDDAEEMEAARLESAASTQRAEEDKAEWETQWSEAGGTAPAASPAAPATTPQQAHADGAAPASAPVHHAEYTTAHSPTLPGAESAAAEAGLGEPYEGAEQASGAEPAKDAETRQWTDSSAASETAVSHSAEPAGHLATEQPYGEGSAAPAADGSGPQGYAVKGSAGSMTYHDETSPSFEETHAEVWFESVAHAEAAGFRAPRRTRH